MIRLTLFALTEINKIDVVHVIGALEDIAIAHVEAG